MSFTAADIVSQEFPHYKLRAPWDSIIGKPQKDASILLFSGPGSGKSTVSLQMADEFTRHGKTAYIPAEEGFSSTLKEKLERLQLMNSGINFKEAEDLEEIKKYVKRENVDMLFIDSFTIIDQRLKTFDEFRKWCKKNDVLFVSVVQTTKDGKFYGNAEAAFNVDCVIKVVDGKPSTIETGKNRLGELYAHEADLRAKPVKPVQPEERKNVIKVAEVKTRINPDDPDYYGIDFIEPEFQEDIRENRAPTPDELYGTITDQILGLIESGKELPWQRPWNMKRNFPHSMPTNFVSKNAYRGINRLLLMFTRVVKDNEGNKVRVLGGFDHPYYLTFKQVDKLGGKIKDGAVGQPAFYFNRLYAYDQVNPDLDYSTIDKKKFINWAKNNWSKIDHSGQAYKNAKEFAEQNHYPLLRYYNLFNGSDIEGIDFGELEKPEQLSEKERIKAGELIVENYPNPPEIVFEGSQPLYSPSKDTVVMPPFTDFKNPQGYYSIFFHELAHSTGHSSRLDRGNDTRKRDGSDEDKKAYKFEELVAEMSAAFISAEAGILFHTREMSAAYLKGYKEALAEYMEEDDRFFFRATSRAQAAADYILDRDENGVPAYLEDFEVEATEKQTPIKGKTDSNPATTDIYFKTDKPIKGRYALMEVKDLIPSHNKDGSQNSKHKISKGQPRDRSDSDLKNQPLRIAQSLNPDLITVGNKAFDGAPVVLPDGQVIQGNGRSIALKIAYDEHEKQAAKYKTYLERNATKFGFTREDVEQFKQPVLVRELDVPESEAIKLGNIVDSSQAKMNRLDQAKAFIRQLDAGKRQIIGRIINSSKGETLGEIIDDKGLDIMDQLKDLDRTGLVKNNELTSDGKDFIKQLFAGLVFDSDKNKDALKHFAKLQHNTKAGIERSYGFIIPFIGTDRDISNTLQKSIEIVQAIQNSDAIDTIPDFLAQGDAFTGPNKDRFNEKEVELAEFLFPQSTQKAIKEAFQVYYFKNIGRNDLLNPVEKVPPAEAFKDAFVEQVRVNPPEDLVKLYTPKDFKKGDIIRDYYDNAKYEMTSKRKGTYYFKNTETGKREKFKATDKRFLRNRDVTPTMDIFRNNPPTELKVRLLAVHDSWWDFSNQIDEVMEAVNDLYWEFTGEDNPYQNEDWKSYNKAWKEIFKAAGSMTKKQQEKISEEYEEYWDLWLEGIDLEKYKDPNYKPFGTLETFRANGLKDNLVHLGFVEQLDWESEFDIPMGIKGNYFLFSSSDGKRLYIIPPTLVDDAKGKLDDKNAEKLYEQWNHFKADHKDLEISFPDGKPQRFATAKQILYASDKIMQPGDGKGKVNFYKHDFDKGKRPVSKVGDVLMIDQIKWDERGILN